MPVAARGRRKEASPVGNRLDFHVNLNGVGLAANGGREYRRVGDSFSRASSVSAPLPTVNLEASYSCQKPHCRPNSGDGEIVGRVQECVLCGIRNWNRNRRVGSDALWHTDTSRRQSTQSEAATIAAPECDSRSHTNGQSYTTFRRRIDETPMTHAQPTFVARSVRTIGL